MKFMILLAALLASVFMVGGYLMAGRFEPEFGRTLFISGAVIFTGIVISATILERNSNE
jgi:hypothetical protein